MHIRRTAALMILAHVWVVAAIGSYPALAASPSYFDMTEISSGDITPFRHWTSMMSRFGAQQKIPDSRCGQVPYHPCTVIDWKGLLASIRKRPLREQLAIVNDWGNAHPYISDQLNWGQDNFWETPYEFMDVSGNCKDYAIAKYYSLRALGIPAERLRVIVLQDLNLGGIIHAVLGVYDGHELLILDNQVKQVVPALNIYHYRPIYGINETRWWEYFPKKG